MWVRYTEQNLLRCGRIPYPYYVIGPISLNIISQDFNNPLSLGYF